jgi:hypothetical protein
VLPIVHGPPSCVRGDRATQNIKDHKSVASLLKQVPEEFLKMITVHELTHLKERQHGMALLPTMQLLGAALPPARICDAGVSDAPGGVGGEVVGCFWGGGGLSKGCGWQGMGRCSSSSEDR